MIGLTLASCHKAPATSCDECLICGAPLEYLHKAETMQCVICGRSFRSDVRCQQGHYVCDECHTSGVDSIIGRDCPFASVNKQEDLGCPVEKEAWNE